MDEFKELDLPPIFDDPRLKVDGKLPVPTFMATQLDTYVIQYQRAQLEKLRNVLKLILYKAKNRRSHWYDIYLTFFVLLHAIECTHQRQQDCVALWTHHVSPAHFPSAIAVLTAPSATTSTAPMWKRSLGETPLPRCGSSRSG